MQSTEHPRATASEVADYVFCRHSWYVRRRGTPVSEQTTALLSADVKWQQQKDGSFPRLIEHETRSKAAVRQAWIAALIVLAFVAICGLYSLLHR